MTQSNPHIPQFRIGQGYDVHALIADRKLILGGVHVPFEKGLLGHSDADALLHALTDALLGAAGLNDIGQLFPDTDPQFKDMDSRILLQGRTSKGSGSRDLRWAMSMPPLFAKSLNWPIFYLKWSVILHLIWPLPPAMSTSRPRPTNLSGT